MTDRRIDVVGIQRREVQNFNVADVVDGGMGNKTANQGPVTKQHFRGTSKIPRLRSDFKVHNMAFGQNGVTNDDASSKAKGKKDPRTLTSAELVERLRLRECSDAIVKIFEIERVTGSEFMEDPELLNELNISNKTDIRKLKSLKMALSKDQV